MASWAGESIGPAELEKTAKFAVVKGEKPEEKKSSSKRRDHMIAIEREVQAAWAASGAFEADEEPGKPKFMVTFPYDPACDATY